MVQRKYLWLRMVTVLAIITLLISGCASAQTSDTNVALGPSQEVSPNSGGDAKDGVKKDTNSDTVRFINATYALITTSNDMDTSIYGGLKRSFLNNMSMEVALKDSWNITDTASAESTIEWLMTEGHNKEFMDLLQEYQDSREEVMKFRQELKAKGSLTSDETQLLELYDMLEEVNTDNPEQGILAWDLCRATQIASWSYVAGFLSYERSMEISIEASARLQEQFVSWDQLVHNYLLGYQYWSGESPEDAKSELVYRKQIYTRLKADPSGPYQVDWNTALQEKDA
ncbi:DUF1266 domain-containing protein [Paenibacillus sp. FSL K6-1230]